MMLIIFRIGAHIPTPGIDGEALSKFFDAQAGSILGFFDMFTGGALGRLTIFALGVMPYISASIIIQLLTVVFPYLERLSKEGEAGRKKNYDLYPLRHDCFERDSVFWNCSGHSEHGSSRWLTGRHFDYECLGISSIDRIDLDRRHHVFNVDGGADQ